MPDKLHSVQLPEHLFNGIILSEVLMNELTLTNQFTTAFPTMRAGIEKAFNIFNSIKSFDDIERIFLMGAGLSRNTYKSYLTAVKQFYSFTNHLNPLQVIPADVERFYDDIRAKVDINTAYQRVKGLKKFFSNISKTIPFYTSPFDIRYKVLERKM